MSAAPPLDGLLIADFSRVLSGPLATMLLADLGATVVKVERPETGDDTRAWGPPYAGGHSTYYLAVNRNKRSVVLDLATVAGRESARRLALDADAVVENFRPGTMERLGLGYDQLAGEHPGLVYCSISGFGRGAGAAIPGYDFVAQALGGLMSITGAPDGEPMKAGVALVDVIAGLFAAIGLLAALAERERSGLGQHVDVDLLSSLLCALANQSSAYAAAGVVGARLGNAHPSVAPYETLQTGDGSIVVAVGTDRQFRALCTSLEAGALCDDARFVTNAARVAHRAQLRPALESALARRATDEWVQRLTAAGVPCARVNDIGQAFALAERLGLEPLRWLEREDGTTVGQVSNPIRLSRTPVRYATAPPVLGEDLPDDIAFEGSPSHWGNLT